MPATSFAIAAALASFAGAVSCVAIGTDAVLVVTRRGTARANATRARQGSGKTERVPQLHLKRRMKQLIV